MNIAILGGTGKEGAGLAMRWAQAGHAIVIGSRDAERARAKAAELCAREPDARRSPASRNAEAARRRDRGAGAARQRPRAPPCPRRARACRGKVVVSTVVPLTFGGRPALHAARRSAPAPRKCRSCSAGGAGGGRVPPHRRARAGRHRARRSSAICCSAAGRRRQGDVSELGRSHGAARRSTWARSPTPDRSRASPRCSPRSTGATSSRTPASRSPGSRAIDRGAAFRRATRRARGRSPPGRAPARRDRGARWRASAGAGSAWLATAAFSSVTCAKSRWLASATAQDHQRELGGQQQRRRRCASRARAAPSCVTL